MGNKWELIIPNFFRFLAKPHIKKEIEELYLLNIPPHLFDIIYWTTKRILLIAIDECLRL